jgi:hypothetical protein
MANRLPDGAKRGNRFRFGVGLRMIAFDENFNEE